MPARPPGARHRAPAGGPRRISGPRLINRWERGFVAVPAWVASALVLGVLLAVAMTALVLIPPGERPRLEPPAPGGATSSPR